MTMTRREFFVAGLAMAATGPASKYQIVDAQIHVWINDPRYPWAAGTKNPPAENRTPEMALELMKANGVAAKLEARCSLPTMASRAENLEVERTDSGQVVILHECLR